MGLKHTILLGWPVLSVLLAFSIITVAIFFQCWTLLKQARVADRKTLKDIYDVVEKRLALLGTIANAAPFVGLLGTVIGIIRAFRSIAQASGAGGADRRRHLRGARQHRRGPGGGHPGLDALQLLHLPQPAHRPGRGRINVPSFPR
jgi:biopolymer transport protein ExbB/TolQ